MASGQQTSRLSCHFSTTRFPDHLKVHSPVCNFSGIFGIPTRRFLIPTRRYPTCICCKAVQIFEQHRIP